MALPNPLISVVMTTYNHEKYIREAIESVLNQTFKDFEFIIVNDGSTDQTDKIIRDFQDQRIIYLSQKNQGPSTAVNNAILATRGKYIALMSGDDVCYPNRLERQYKYLSSTNHKITFSWVDFIDDNSDIITQKHFAENLFNHPNRTRSEILKYFFFNGNYINGITGFFYKELLVEAGLYNLASIQIQDFEMWIKLLTKYDLHILPEKLIKYRIRSHNANLSSGSNALRATFELSQMYKNIFNDFKIEIFKEAFADQIIKPGFSSLIEYELEKAFLYLKHNANYMKGIGAEKLFNLLQNEQILNVSKEEYNFGLPELFKLTQNIDIANIEVLQQYRSEILSKSAEISRLKSLFRHLYWNDNQLQLLSVNFLDIPEDLLSEYVQLLLSSKEGFNLLGEAEQYYEYIEKCIHNLYEHIFNNLNSTSSEKIANSFFQTANFIPIYFNEKNLKDIYIKRAEIIEYFLKLHGCEIDYEFPERPANRKKIRVGILAAHFTPGSETFAYLPVYEYLSRDFEVILYSLNATGHPLEQYCQSCANSFKVLPKDLSTQVNTIRADDLDILFIATNVTAVTNQICLLATHRLARIQVTSGGSVVTTGMGHMDYYISGTLTDPSPTAQEHYREKLVKLEGTAHCFSYGCDPEKATVKVNRENLGISEEAVIFISGANFFKIVPELIHTWAKIIAEVPNSVLILLPFGPNWSNAYPKKNFENNLNQVFSKYEISADRLIILDPQPVPNREDVKEYFKIADVYLDSYPFAGTTSLVEPLQVNLPVIARQGNNFRSAMGAAMIQSLGISDLVADNEESYIQLAVNLGKNPELCQQKSAEIKEKMQDNPSFLDSRSYSAKIGNLFQELFQNYQTNTLNENCRFRDINLIIFPDWNQSEESIGLELQAVIKTLATYPDSQKTTLLIDTSNIAVEDAEMFLSSVAMNLLMESDLDMTEELEISLIGELSNIQWKTLLSRIQARIILENDNQEAVMKLSMAKLPQRKLESFQPSAV